MRVLALDVANSTGYATHSDLGDKHGILKVHPREGEIEPVRYWRMYCAVRQLSRAICPKWAEEGFLDLLIVTEGSPGFTRGHSSVKVANELRGAIKVFCGQHNVPYYAVNPGTLKKFGAGNGRAKKPEMIAAARTKYGYRGSNDDEADAMHMRAMVLHWGWKTVNQRISERKT